jgi:hypothetical protein
MVRVVEVAYMPLQRCVFYHLNSEKTTVVADGGWQSTSMGHSICMAAAYRPQHLQPLLPTVVAHNNLAAAVGGRLVLVNFETVV